MVYMCIVLSNSMPFYGIDVLRGTKNAGFFALRIYPA